MHATPNPVMPPAAHPIRASDTTRLIVLVTDGGVGVEGAALAGRLRIELRRMGDSSSTTVSGRQL